MARILIAEDSQDYQRLLRRMLERGGHAVILAETPQDTVAHAFASPPDLMILDWVLRHGTGLDALKRVKSEPRLRFIPAILISAIKESPDDEALALSCGADVFLSKEELGSHKTLLRRIDALLLLNEPPPASPSFFLDDLRLDSSSLKALVAGRPIRLGPKEASLLQILVRRPQIVHTHAHLWDSIWSYPSDARDHILASTFCSLRRKLGRRWARRLECRRGLGYLLRYPD